MKYSPPLSPGTECHFDDRLAQATALEADKALTQDDGPARAGFTGLVFAVSQTEGAPLAAISAGGIPIIRRQIRQLNALGAQRIVLACMGDQGPAIGHARREASRNGIQLDLAESPEALVAAVSGAQTLAIDEGLLIDERLLEAFLAGDPGEDAQAVARVAAFDAKGLKPAGLALFTPGAIDQPLAEALLDGALSRLSPAVMPVCDLSGIDEYAPARRRSLPMVWLRLASASDGRKGTSLLLESAQKGCLDWPARFIHPPVENLLTRLLLPTPVTPNMISVFAFLIGLYAAWCFATGSWGTALALALMIGPLDGIDGKLARTRLEFSRWGDLEHVADKIVEYLFYIGMAAWFGTGWAWAVCAIAMLFALAEAVQGEFYRRFSGGQLDDAGKAERRFRLVSGRRNTFMWCLIPFVAFDAWAQGFVMIAIYSAATFFFMQWRFFVRLGEVGCNSSPHIAQNMRRTAYAFLKQGQ